MKKFIAFVLVALLALSAALAETVYTDKETVKQVQQALNDAGFDCGTPDGAAGNKTKAAISDYQAANGLEQTGVIDEALLIALGLVEPPVGEGEIAFQGVAWGTRSENLIKTLRDAGFYPPENNGVDIAKEFDGVLSHVREWGSSGGKILRADDGLIYRPEDISEFSAALNNYDIYGGNDESQIAGYDVEYWWPTFVFEDGASKLIYVEVVLKNNDPNAAYQDLLAKLTAVYGEGEHGRSEDAGVTTDVWLGENDTAVVLYARLTNEDIYELRICYGKTDAEATVAAAVESIEPVDASDTSGL